MYAAAPSTEYSEKRCIKEPQYSAKEPYYPAIEPYYSTKEP